MIAAEAFAPTEAFSTGSDRAEPSDRTLLAAGLSLLRRHETVAAKRLLLYGCRLAPASADAWHALGLALVRNGEFGDAEAAFAEAERLGCSTVELALARVNAAVRAGTADAELDRLAVRSLADPFDAVALTARGVLLSRLGRGAEGIDLLEAAVALAPSEVGPAIELANALMHTDRTREAEASLARAIALAPRQWMLRNNRAVILMRSQRFEEARDELQALITANGEEPGLLCNLSNVLNALGEQDAGVSTARRATELVPDMHLAWRSLLNALAYRSGVDGATMRQTAERASECILRGPPARSRRSPGADRRLRVGLLSTTLKTHPVGWLTVAGFESLDPTAFELVCCGQRDIGDPIARRFRAIAASWHVVEGLELAETVRAVRALDLDVLIELSGYGDRGLLAACAHRLAPVQVKWVGMQNHSTGLPEMDWFLTDRWETPPGAEALYTERLLRLPDGYVCYSPPIYAPDVGPLPALRMRAVTFGCFNNLAKITPDVIAAWSELLRRMPSARLVLKTHQFGAAQTRARLHAAFAAEGVDAKRVELRGGSGHRALLEEYNDIDIVLDPFPYTGGLTTCEALWMGVPTVTWAGEIFAARHAASHLCNVGLVDWVAQDRAGYLDTALSRATDLDALALLRASLRPRMKASPLCDAARFGKNLGAALRGAWRAWCDGQAS